MTLLPQPQRRVAALAWRGGDLVPAQRTVPAETAIAFTYGGSTHAVMMATPADLTDLAIGFTLAEGIAETVDDIRGVEVVPADRGIELRIDLAAPLAERHAARRRAMAGPVGCGLCGIESLEQALMPPRHVAGGGPFAAAALAAAVADLGRHQPMNAATHALHAAAFWTPDGGIAAVREDVGRHNALDKLTGALAQARLPTGVGAVLLTSRVSVELVQKAATAGIPLIAAISAPTALAIETAEAAGITLVAVVRADGFEVFTHPHRVRPAAAAPASVEGSAHVA